MLDLAMSRDTVRIPAAAVPRPEPQLFFADVPCGNSDCASHRILVAVRPPATTREECVAEILQWNASEMVCEKGHLIAKPSPLTFWTSKG